MVLTAYLSSIQFSHMKIKTKFNITCFTWLDEWDFGLPARLYQIFIEKFPHAVFKFLPWMCKSHVLDTLLPDNGCQYNFHPNPCFLILKYVWKFCALDFPVVPVSRPCIRFLPFRLCFKASTELSLVFVVSGSKFIQTPRDRNFSSKGPTTFKIWEMKLWQSLITNMQKLSVLLCSIWSYG